MPVPLSPDQQKQAIASIKRYCDEALELSVGDLKAGNLLDFFLKELAPTIYNRAIGDAQVYLRDRLADLEGVCYEPEFAYWPKGKTVRRKGGGSEH